MRKEWSAQTLRGPNDRAEWSPQQRVDLVACNKATKRGAPSVVHFMRPISDPSWITKRNSACRVRRSVGAASRNQGSASQTRDVLSVSVSVRVTYVNRAKPISKRKTLTLHLLAGFCFDNGEEQVESKTKLCDDISETYQTNLYTMRWVKNPPNQTNGRKKRMWCTYCRQNKPQLPGLSHRAPPSQGPRWSGRCSRTRRSKWPALWFLARMHYHRSSAG